MAMRQLEHQYLTGQLRDTFPGLFAAFERANARILSDLDWQLNVPYGRDPRETFDLCRAPALALGTVLFFHGGYWQSRDKSQFRFMAGAWAKAGFNVALAGYRLCPDISVRDLTASIQAVPLAVVHALPATQRNLPIILAGHSAGAHLAIELALAWKTRNPATATLAGVVAISGIYDLTPLVPTTLNERLRLDLSQARQCSPIFRVQGGISPAAFLVGGAETPAFLRQSREMAEHWAAHGNSATYQALYGQDHFSVLAMLTADHGPLAEQALAFISRPG